MTTVLARYSTLKLMDHFRVPKDLPLRVNDLVVLRTKRGTELGQVKLAPGEHRLTGDQIVAGEVLRKPSLEDSTKFREQKGEDFKPIKRKFRELAAKHKLAMRYQNTERLLSGDKLIVYFTAEDRLDFREFVKEFTEAVGQRVELRQVGARDAARVTGDVGVCGQELCCVSYIIDFVPVSMKMAKTQRISLDPAKISGQCGRLKCCLKYEDDLYNSLRQHMPLDGQPATCEGKDCHVCNVNILEQKVTIDFGDGRREERDVKDIQFEGGWSDKDIRRYRRERRAKFLEERAARDAARSARQKAVTDRRHGQDAVHPSRRDDDKPLIEPEPGSGESAAYPPVEEPPEEREGNTAEEREGNTAEIARQIPPDTGMIKRPVIESEPGGDVAMDEADMNSDTPPEANPGDAPDPANQEPS